MSSCSSTFFSLSPLSSSPSMATEVINKVQNLFDKLEARRSILSTCTDLYKTLTSHFSSLEQSIASKSQTLDSRIQALDSDYQTCIDDLKRREECIPDRLASISSHIEAQKQSALIEIQNTTSEESPSMVEELKSLCRKMDESKLLKLLMAKRKEASMLKSEIGNALNECVDPPRLVLDSVKEFMELKANVKSGQPDRRWACGIVVGGLFPLDGLKERKEGAFSRAILERAEAMAKEWKEKAQERATSGVASGSGEGMYGMGPAEASMFLQFVLGFGLKGKFDFEFFKNLVMEFSSRRDMARLAAPLFGEKVEDVIDDLVNTGKEVDAVYFASEAGLTEKLKAANLLKSYLTKSEKNSKDILTKGNNSSVAADEANVSERTALKLIIKCVEENKLEAEFPLQSVKRRLSVLERIKNEKKKAVHTGSKPSSNKRGHRSGPPPPHPAKIPRLSGPYPPHGQRNPVSPAYPSSVSRYPGPYNYPSYNALDAGLTATPFVSSYSGSHLPSPAQASQPAYGNPGESVGGLGARVGGSYGGQLSYGSYDYGSSAPNTYQPSSYTQ